ncbi:hypothetical protein CNMCM5623_009018 [Aspergillus felis]|uniref:Cytochrome P450 n=1 Tax=Aspergillus felis TaxID=1287682 RepID=A0A8H6Q006_9EURO|nr:hypothetical protein CNMCM5623_009018 [Aspergillus felis]
MMSPWLSAILAGAALCFYVGWPWYTMWKRAKSLGLPVIVEGSQWQRHRRHTAQAFNKKTHENVWAETLKETSMLLEYWTNDESKTITRSDLAALSLAVLCRVCFGMSEGDATREKTGMITSELRLFLKSITRPAVFGPLSKQEKKDVAASQQTLKRFMAKLVETRRDASSSRQGSSDLIAWLLGTIDSDQFSEDEIMGNLFLFIFAGHETTAGTLGYIIHLLAIYPAWQDWVIEEVDLIYQESTRDGNPDYSETYHRLTRLRAVLFETLRLYGPVPTIVRKSDKQHNQVVTVGQKEVVIPGDCQVYINTIAIHTDPDDWGPDSQTWRPDRWISEASSTLSECEFSSEMSKCIFAWGDGPRMCPGRKFSQVEILASLLRLFMGHRVEIVPRAGQSLQDARSEAYSLIQDSTVGLTLQMPGHRPVNLRWIRR